MRLSSARAAVALAAPAGVLAGHAVGYLPGDPHSAGHAVDHSYLAGAAAVAGPLVVAAMLWAALGGARGRSRPPAVGPLLVAQSALFTGQEMVEHTLAGHGAGEALRSPAVWTGLAAQALVALALALLLGAATAAGARAVATLSRGSSLPAGPAGWFRPGSPWRPPGAVAAALPARSPPASLA